MQKQRLYVGVGYPGEAIEKLVSLVIEEVDRDDMKDVVSQTVDAVYDQLEEVSDEPSLETA